MNTQGFWYRFPGAASVVYLNPQKYQKIRHYRIQFVLCSCKVVDRNERKKWWIIIDKNKAIKQWGQLRNNVFGGEKTS